MSESKRQSGNSWWKLSQTRCREWGVIERFKEREKKKRKKKTLSKGVKSREKPKQKDTRSTVQVWKKQNKRLETSVWISEPGIIKAAQKPQSPWRYSFIVIGQRKYKKTTVLFTDMKCLKMNAAKSSEVFRCDTNIWKGNPGILQWDVLSDNSEETTWGPGQMKYHSHHAHITGSYHCCLHSHSAIISTDDRWDWLNRCPRVD